MSGRGARQAKEPLRRLWADERGNVTLITAGGMMMMLFAVGFGIDYARAEMFQTKLNAAADAAVLVAVDPAEANASDAQAQLDAQKMFDGQAAQLAGQGVAVVSRSVSAQTTSQLNSAGVTQLIRTASVTYSATVNTLFSKVLGANTLTVSGTTSSSSTRPPNINFYVLLDASPSMLLPSSSSGLSNIYSATSCDFACHEQLPHNDGIYVRDNSGRDVFLNSNYYGTGTGAGTYYFINPSTKGLYNASGTQIGYNAAVSGTTLSYTPLGSYTTSTIPGYYADGYWLTHNYGKIYSGQSAIELRVSDETTAAQDLIPFATSQASAYQVTYQLQFFAFNWTHQGQSSPVTAYGTMTNVANLTSSAVPNIDSTQDYWYTNNCPSSSYCINDQGSEFYNMFTAMNTIMPAPGTGASSSSPQETLMLITDGMSDENYGSGRTHSPLTQTILDQCTAIKTRGIRIAILYTQYLPDSLAGDSWSQSNVLPYLSPTDQDAVALKSCASANSDGSPLFYQVTTGQSISSALQALFAMSLKTAHLTN